MTTYQYPADSGEALHVTATEQSEISELTGMPIVDERMTLDADLGTVLSKPTENTEFTSLETLGIQAGDVNEIPEQGVNETLVLGYLGLAKNLAARFTNSGIPFEDLEQVARLGLVKAAKRFDPNKGFSFMTFAYPTIEGELKRFLRDKDWNLKIPRRVKAAGLEIKESRERLTQTLQRKVTVQEIADDLEMPVDEAKEAIDATTISRRTVSFGCVDAKTGRELSEVIASDDLLPEDLATNSAALEAELEKLSARDQKIIRLRFYDGLTQTAIAQRTGLSQMHVSRLIKKSLNTLRMAFTAADTL